VLSTEQMRIDPVYRERLRAAGLDTVARVLQRVEGRVAAWSRTTDTLFVPGGDGMPGFYIKRHFFPTWTKRLRGTFRGTFFGMNRGQAEYRALDAMRSLGVPAVRPVAFGSRRSAHFLSACFLITEEVPGAENLTTFALEVAAGRRRLTPAQRRELPRVLAEQLAAMHTVGCSHGNLFWRNLLVRQGPDGRPEFFFLDAQPLRPWERLGPGGNWWLRELAQVAVSAMPFTTRVERLRFFRHYLRDTRPLAELKTLLRQVESLAATWRRHEESLAATWRRHEDRRIHMNSLFEAWNRRLADETCSRRLDGWPVAAEPGP